MIRELERYVALTIYANTSIRGRSSGFDLDRLVADRLYSIEFLDSLPEGVVGAPRVIATSAEAWVKGLAEDRAESVVLHRRPANNLGLAEHIRVAFRGGGKAWLLEVVMGDSSDVYSDEPDLEGTGYPSAKTRFTRLQKQVTPLTGTYPNVSAARETLDLTLRDLSSFASCHEHAIHWVDNFNSARAILYNDVSQTSDLFLPPGIVANDARQLIEAALGSWVFGGMGSWNDMAFQGDAQEEYDELTRALHEAICHALAAGANSSAL